MQLLNCHIVNFGCLSDRSYHFKNGLNLLLADNGSGKSTLTVFIKAMLFGLPVSGKRDIAENERKRYKPWNNGLYGGSIEFEVQEKTYRAERFFGAKERDDRFALYNLATGKPSDDFSENLGEELFGVDADGFERSLYISQRYPFLSPDNNSIRKKLGSLFEVSDDLGDFEKADGILDRARKLYRTTGERGKIGDLTRAALKKSEEIRASENAAEAAHALASEIQLAEERKKQLLCDIEAARAGRSAAEKRRLKEELGASYRRLSEAIENEKRILLPLDAFFAKHLPTEKELAEAETAWQKAEECQAKLSIPTLSEEDADHLGKLRARYGDVPPDAAVTDGMRKKLALYKEACLACEQTAPKEDTEWDALKARFAQRFPTEEEIDALHKATDAYDNAEADLLIADQAKRQRTPFPVPSILCGGGALLGIFLALVGIFTKPVPISVIGAALFLLGTVLAVLLFFLLPKPKNLAFLALEAEQKKLSALLTPYPYKEKNPSVAAKLLFTDVSRYRTLAASEAARIQAHEKACTAKQTAERELQNALSRYGITEEGESGVLLFEKETELYTRLHNAAMNAERREHLLRQSYTVGKEAVDTFLSDYEETATLPTREALAAVRQKLLLSRESLLRYEDGKHKLEAFLKETSFDPTEPLPPTVGDSEEFAYREKQLTASLLALEKEIASQNAEAERLNEIAALAPLKRAEKQAIEEEKAEAEHTCDLIQTTRQLLTDAKEDLSTRYLGDMEAHFAHYLDLLGTENESFRFNTDLALSTERMGERRGVEVLSRGEQDLIAFCARIALIEAIFSKQTPFLVLDDPFVNLDDKNYAHAMSLLGTLGARFQILYTVCAESRLPR